jgi:hypothetical protein
MTWPIPPLEHSSLSQEQANKADGALAAWTKIVAIAPLPDHPPLADRLAARPAQGQSDRQAGAHPVRMPPKWLVNAAQPLVRPRSGGWKIGRMSVGIWST